MSGWMQCEDWETGEMVIIHIDPSKPPSESAEALYRSARKQDRTGGAIAPIIEVLSLYHLVRIATKRVLRAHLIL